MQALPLVATAASTAFGVIGKQQAGKAEEQRLEQQAQLAETRAVQKDLERRQELNRVQSAIKAARATRGGSLRSPLTQTFLNEANDVIGTERLRAFASERQQAQNLRTSAAASRRNRRLGLFGGAIKTGVPLFQAGMNSFSGSAAPSSSPVPTARPF